MQVNDKALIDNLRLTFSGSTQFIAELLQNARRAHATQIDVTFDDSSQELIVSDNGLGIGDMQSLLSIADTGWDEQTQSSETPYGMGFLSALFAAFEVEVRSRGVMVAFETECAISFDGIDVHRLDEPINGTTVIMRGVDLDHQRVRSAMVRFTEGFPVPVTFNGEVMERPYAVDQKAFRDCSIGALHVYGLDGEQSRELNHSGAEQTLFFLQGQQVYSTHRSPMGGACNIVHLDPQRFRGRLPDRDKLLTEDEEKACEKADEILKGVWRAHYTALKDALEADDFVELCADHLSHWKCLDLLNDIPYLPGSFLMYYNSDLVIDPVPAIHHADRMVSWEEIVQGDVFIVSMEWPGEVDEGFAAATLATKKTGIYLSDHLKSLDPNHWVHPYIIDLDEEDVEVSAAAIKTSRFDGLDVLFCESYTLTHKDLGAVNVDCDAVSLAWGCRVYDQDGLEVKPVPKVLIPSRESGGLVAEQLDYFYDEFDQRYEDAAEQAATQWRQFILSNREGQEAEALRSILRDGGVTGFESFKGKSFTVSLSDSGELIVDQA